MERKKKRAHICSSAPSADQTSCHHLNPSEKKRSKWGQIKVWVANSRVHILLAATGLLRLRSHRTRWTLVSPRRNQPSVAWWLQLGQRSFAATDVLISYRSVLWLRTVHSHWVKSESKIQFDLLPLGSPAALSGWDFLTCITAHPHVHTVEGWSRRRCRLSLWNMFKHAA